MKQHTKAIFHSIRVKFDHILTVGNLNPLTEGELGAEIAKIVERLSKDQNYNMHKHRLGDQISVLFHKNNIAVIINEHKINVWLAEP